MNPHAFLSFIQNNYDFNHANAIFSQLALKNCWKQWLTAELVNMASNTDGYEQVQTDLHYPSQQGADNEALFLRYQQDDNVDVVNKKNLASRSDFSWCHLEQQYYFEIRCANRELFSKNKDLVKFANDIRRIKQLKQANPELNIAVVFAFYGSFSSTDINKFSEFDNSQHCTYMLDTGLSGSTSIARLAQMRRAGDERLCLALYTGN